MMSSTGGGGGGGGGKTVQLWKTNDMKANKTGPRHTVYYVKKNPDHEKAKRTGAKTVPGVFKSGPRYAGEWRGNRKDGYGTLTLPNGDKYEGEWADNMREGRGTLWQKSGGKLKKRYTGDWYKNRRHGKGIYYFENGNRYEGSWDMGKRTGHGVMEYASGDVYDGEWLDDQREGMGVLTLAKGDIYEGSFSNDKKEGSGRYIYVATRKMYEGEWVEDVAKCGVFSELPDEFFEDEGKESMPKPDYFKMPALELKDPDGVLRDAVAETRELRWERLGGSRTLGGGGASEEDLVSTLSPEEIGQLLEAFGMCDDGTGCIKASDLPKVLGELGVTPTAEDLVALMEELGAEPDSLVEFDAFAACMARLRE